MASFALGLSLLAQNIVDPALYSSDRPLFNSRGLSFALARADDAPGGGATDPKSEEEGGMSKEELAKLAQHPLANLMSFPFQNNFNFGVGPNHTTTVRDELPAGHSHHAQ
jgi:hypothetical protein